MAVFSRFFKNYLTCMIQKARFGKKQVSDAEILGKKQDDEGICLMFCSFLSPFLASRYQPR